MAFLPDPFRVSPCALAVARSPRAKANGRDVITIGEVNRISNTPDNIKKPLSRRCNRGLDQIYGRG